MIDIARSLLPPLILALAAALGPIAARAQGLAQVPLFLSPAINPNVLVMLDTSQSMDASMGGRMLSGSDEATRSNVARAVLREIIKDHRYSFNWGLGSFEIKGTPAWFNIFGYYLGDSATMVYTDAGTCTDIVDGVGTSSIAGLRCTLNPEPNKTTGEYPFITFARSGDDPDVNDVTYGLDLQTSSPQCVPPFGQRYGYQSSSGSELYVVFQNRVQGVGWDVDGEFLTCTVADKPLFSTTDSGWSFKATDWPRRLWIARGWGYNNEVTGEGRIVEPVIDVQAAETSVEAAHYSRMNELLAAEDSAPASTNLKNAASRTPLAGSMRTSGRYFRGEVSSQTSPITAACQRNYVVLATDGNPTARVDGTPYDPADWVNTYDPATKLWTYGPAIVDVLNEINALRTTTKGGLTYDVQTYVIGMGDTVVNPSSVASLDAMASAGGTDKAFLANDDVALRKAFEAVTANIQAKTSGAASAGVNSGSWQTGATLYQGRFSSVDWSGNLLAIPVGIDGALSPIPAWDAASRLKLLDWDSGRAIVTARPTLGGGKHGVAFRWPLDPAEPTVNEIALSQVLALNRDANGSVDGLGAQRLRYLRGDPSNEIRNCADCKFRNRPTTVLGDIIGSGPVHVGAPSAVYYDDFESVPYSTFAANWRGRPPHVFVGANDGMLHAFDAVTGDERFAYVPGLIFGSLSALTAAPFTHRYNVDGTPTVADVFYGGGWHTLLVAGLRAGGRGLYALDITDPGVFTEAGAAALVRWEADDADLGHVFSPPMLVKTNNGRWSVIAGNGYGSAGSGRAVLFVIDAETGVVVRKIDAGSAIGNGLGGPAAIDINGDGVVDVVYAGDLSGKLWKFDLGAALPSDWTVAAGGAALFDAGAGKPITARPDVTRSSKGGFLITFGTGRYMSWTDPTSTAPQSIFGVWDKDGSVVTQAQLQPQLLEATTATVGGDTYRIGTHRVGEPTDAAIANDEPTISVDAFYATKRGWYVDLPIAGERVVADARIRGGRAIFTSLIPDNGDPCAYGGSGWILEFDVFTGNRLGSATFDVDNNGKLDAADYVVFDGVSSGANNTSGWKIGAVPSGPAFMGFRDGTANTEMKYVNTSEGIIVQKREAAGTGGEGRVMWRVVQ